MSRYAIQHGCRWGCLFTGRELVCCSFHTVAAPQVSHLSASRKNDVGNDASYSMCSVACVAAWQCGQRKMWSASAVQGGPRELIMTLADVVSYSSTDPTMGQELVYLSTVQSHSGASVMPAFAPSSSRLGLNDVYATSSSREWKSLLPSPQQDHSLHKWAVQHAHQHLLRSTAFSPCAATNW